MAMLFVLVASVAREGFGIIGVMQAGRFKVMVNMSSDHAGIATSLKQLERRIYGVIAHIDDARKVRDFLAHLEFESQQWGIDHDVDMRGWMDNGRYRKE